MQFSTRLEELRPAGMSDYAFARLLKLPYMTLKGLLAGSSPTEKTISKIAAALDKTMAEVRYGNMP